MKHKRLFSSIVLVLGALAVGKGAHFYIFSYSFFSSPLVWVAVVMRAVCAFAAGFLWRRYNLAPWALWFIFFSIEYGPIVMASWALFNYSETGKVGFNVAYWIIPSAVDFLMLWIGSRFNGIADATNESGGNVAG